jgi:tetratricopeptide (TPR) repeat protein
VDEPYLAGTADVSVFAARFIYQGFSFGEAACAAQNVLSWQTTIVGDPLYRPFGKTPEQQHVALEASHSKMLEWSYLRLLNLNQTSGKPLHELTTLLENLELTKQSAILSEKLGDLYTEAGKPASSIHEYTQALKLDPSPQQKLRLLLTLGAKLTALNREAEACENYQILLKEFPTYADRATITNKLADLDKKLRKPSEPQKIGDPPKQR